MNSDIAERRQAEDALRESEERLAAEADALARLNKLSSRLWRTLDLSQGLEEMLTATIDLLGADMGNIQLLDGATLRIATQRGFKQDFLDFFREVSTEDESACGRALRTREPIMIEDVEADAGYAPMRDVARAAGYRAVVSTPLIARDGEPLGMVSAHFRSPHRPEEQEFGRLMLYVRQAADFIERYKIEAALRDTAEQLHRQSERLQEEDRNKNQFLGLLGHELRNPLAAISNTVDVLRLEKLPVLERAEGIERIDHQTKHLLRLVDDLLNITRISRGQIELQKTPIDLADSITVAVDQVRPQIEACHHRLTLSLPEQPICVKADRERLTQIVNNLLINAAHYTEPGGEITLTVQRAGDQALLKVRDTGIGIAAEHLPHLFEPFRRLASVAGHHPSGLGLGLALARQLAELHGGSLNAFSDGPGQGSEFTLRLPALPAKQSVMPAPPPTGRHGETETPDRRVLVVEDDVAVGDALVLLLRALGHEVRIVTRGGEASEAVRTFHPELVLLDIGLPDMSGYEVARRLRQENDLQAFRLVALTGFGGDEDLAQVKAAGFDCRLLKPMRMEALQAILKGL